jgi:hypothetical protein
VEYFTGRLYEYSSLAREELSILATPLLCPLIQRAADVVLAIGRSGENGSAMNGPIRTSRLQPSLSTESLPNVRSAIHNQRILDSKCPISYHRVNTRIPMRDRHGKCVLSAVAIRDYCTKADDTTIKNGVLQREADVREGYSRWQQLNDNVLESMVLPHETTMTMERNEQKKSALNGVHF